MKVRFIVLIGLNGVPICESTPPSQEVLMVKKETAQDKQAADQKKERSGTLSRVLRLFSRKSSEGAAEGTKSPNPQQSDNSAITTTTSSSEEPIDWVMTKSVVLQAQEVIGESRSILRSKVGEIIESDTKKDLTLEYMIETLDYMRMLFCTYCARADANFEESYKATLHDNFMRVSNFDPQKVYDHLGYDIEWGVLLPNERFSKLIQQRRDETTDKQEEWLMRQMGTLFASPLTKQVFDALMTGGDKAVAELKIDAGEVPSLWQQIEKIAEIKGELINYQKDFEAATKASEKHVSNTRKGCIII